MKKDIVACSGGKDSTAVALLLHDRGVPFDLLYTPTGNEPPGVWEHIQRLAEETGADIILPEAPTLFGLIDRFNAIPNFRMRFCTRMIKIEPCIKWFKDHGTGKVLHIGLRADEPDRKGIYDELVNRRFILREIDWDVEDVVEFVKGRGFEPPPRTDCMLCPFEALNDWFWLWRTYPEEYAKGIEIEDRIGHTFRKPKNDTWATDLRGLAAEFEGGRRPLKRRMRTPCRVCVM